MTDYQNELVMEHLDLVNWVIRTRISVPNRPLGWNWQKKQKWRTTRFC